METTQNSKNARGPGGRFGKLVESPLFWVIFVALSFGVPIYRSLTIPKKAPLPVLGTLPNFELQNQEGRTVKFRDYQGAVKVVNFIFTSCPNSCPLLTQQMKKIQERMSSARTNVHLMSISVDPETDTPAVLKEYGAKYNADFKQWSFLTGQLESIEKVVVGGFKIAMAKEKPAKPDATSTLMDITHGEHFVIVDQLGQIRAYTRADNNEQINEIVRKVAILMNSSPRLNIAR